MPHPSDEQPFPQTMETSFQPGAVAGTAGARQIILMTASGPMELVSSEEALALFVAYQADLLREQRGLAADAPIEGALAEQLKQEINARRLPENAGWRGVMRHVSEQQLQREITQHRLDPEMSWEDVLSMQPSKTELLRALQDCSTPQEVGCELLRPTSMPQVFRLATEELPPRP